MSAAADDAQTRWVAVAAAGDWTSDGGRVVQVGARRIGVYRHAGAWYALKDICPHAGVSLAKGPVHEGSVMCVGHGWRFSLATGELVGKGGFHVATYPVRLREDGVVEIGV